MNKLKNIVNVSIIVSLFASCNAKPETEIKQINQPIKITNNQGYTEHGELLQKSTFNDFKSKYKRLKTDKLYSHGKLIFNNSNKVLIVTEDPVETYRGDLYLINFNIDFEPIDILKIDDLDNTAETEIKNDTIYKLIKYNYSDWVEKYVITNEGKFVMVEEKKVWADTTYNPN